MRFLIIPHLLEIPSPLGRDGFGLGQIIGIDPLNETEVEGSGERIEIVHDGQGEREEGRLFFRRGR